MSSFELVDYDRIASLKSNLIIGVRNNGKWVFEGVLTEGEVDLGIMTALFDHMHDNQELHETQALYAIKVEMDEDAFIVKLKTLGIQERGHEIQGDPDVPELPVGFGRLEDLPEIHTYFTGQHDFHENYPQLMESLEPFAKLLQKSIEGRA